MRAAATAVREKCPNGLDVLVNNAGVMALEDRATKDGFDVQMQTNVSCNKLQTKAAQLSACLCERDCHLHCPSLPQHLSHFLLTAELLPLLEQGAEARGEARVVQHSSIMRLAGKRPLQAQYFGPGGNLGGDRTSVLNPTGGPRWIRYQQTKLAASVFCRALHDRLAQRGSKASWW